MKRVSITCDACVDMSDMEVSSFFEGLNCENILEDSNVLEYIDKFFHQTSSDHTNFDDSNKIYGEVIHECIIKITHENDPRSDLLLFIINHMVLKCGHYSFDISSLKSLLSKDSRNISLEVVNLFIQLLQLIASTRLNKTFTALLKKLAKNGDKSNFFLIVDCLYYLHCNLKKTQNDSIISDCELPEILKTCVDLFNYDGLSDLTLQLEPIFTHIRSIESKNIYTSPTIFIIFVNYINNHSEFSCHNFNAILANLDPATYDRVFLHIFLAIFKLTCISKIVLRLCIPHDFADILRRIQRSNLYGNLITCMKSQTKADKVSYCLMKYFLRKLKISASNIFSHKIFFLIILNNIDVKHLHRLYRRLLDNNNLSVAYFLVKSIPNFDMDCVVDYYTKIFLMSPRNADTFRKCLKTLIRRTPSDRLSFLMQFFRKICEHHDEWFFDVFEDLLNKCNQHFPMKDPCIQNLISATAFYACLYNIDNFEEIKTILNDISACIEKMESQDIYWYDVIIELILSISVSFNNFAHSTVLKLAQDSKKYAKDSTFALVINILESPTQETEFFELPLNDKPLASDQAETDKFSLNNGDIDLTTLTENDINDLDTILSKQLSLKKQSKLDINIQQIQMRMIDYIECFSKSPLSTYNRMFVSLQLMTTLSKKINKNNKVYTSKLKDCTKSLISHVDSFLSEKSLNDIYKQFRSSTKTLPTISLDGIWSQWISALIKISRHNASKHDSYILKIKQFLNKTILKSLNNKRDCISQQFFLNLFSSHTYLLTDSQYLSTYFGNFLSIRGRKAKIDSHMNLFIYIIKNSNVDKETYYSLFKKFIEDYPKAKNSKISKNIIHRITVISRNKYPGLESPHL